MVDAWASCNEDNHWPKQAASCAHLKGAASCRPVATDGSPPRKPERNELVDPWDTPLPLHLRPKVTWPGYHAGREPANKGKRYPIEVLTRSEVISLMEAVAGNDRTRLRNLAVITSMYRAGLRINESKHLRSKDLDPEHGLIRVLFAKGQTSRTVGIDDAGMEVLLRWEKVRLDMDVDLDAPLFCSSTGRLLSHGYIRQMLYAAGGKARIQKRVHPHGLRHAHAFEMVMEGIPLPIVQRQLGRVWMSSTANYVDHVAPMEVVARIRMRAWALPFDLLESRQ